MRPLVIFGGGTVGRSWPISRATVNMLHLKPADFFPEIDSIISVGHFYEKTAGSRIIFTWSIADSLHRFSARGSRLNVPVIELILVDVNCDKYRSITQHHAAEQTTPHQRKP